MSSSSFLFFSFILSSARNSSTLTSSIEALLNSWGLFLAGDILKEILRGLEGLEGLEG